jgi:hypothetical protein
VTTDTIVKSRLDELAAKIETSLDSDVLAVYGPIVYGCDYRLRDAIEGLADGRKYRLAVLLNTNGGVVEIVERMVDVIRHHYRDLTFVIPDRAMSAGTVFVMAGDTIMMDYFSRLGPIDPQIEKDGRLVPALSYLAQFNRLLERARQGQLSDAEFALLHKFDLAEIHQYEQARELTITPLKKWLATYKFKYWAITETTRREVTDDMRAQRATEIARALSDNERWHSHGRGLSMATLRDELNLKIDDFPLNSELSTCIRTYHELLFDYLTRHNFPTFFIHTRRYF